MLIENDVFDIACRLKGLDINYKIYFNVGTAKFEIHNDSCKPSLQLVLPFHQLDCRTIDYVNKTKVQNLENILKEIERHNLEIEEQNQYQIAKNASKRIEEIVAS